MKNKKLQNAAIAAGGAALVAGATILIKSKKTIPDGAIAVKNFDAEKYLGKWYEIARLDFRFERNQNNTTAYYSLNDDGSIKVENRGYDYEHNKWKEAIGKARFIGEPGEAKLKVTFFGPFYAGYNVIAIDDEYRYALVAGKNLKYLWLLSREKNIPNEIKQAYLKKARQIGYKTEDLVWVKHN